jgi:hypothetical protein
VPLFAVKIRRKTVIDRSTLALVAVVAAFGFASPAFAQAFKPDDGGGTVLAAYYGPHRGLHTGKFAPKNKRVATHQSGLHAFAQAPSPSGTSSFYRDNPSLTGGGSAGYNFMESQDGSAATLH